MPSLLCCFGSTSKDERPPCSTMDNLITRPPCSTLDKLNLGIGVCGGRMSVLIPANTNIPTKKEKIFSLGDFHSTVSVPVYEGQSSSQRENFLLGSFILDEILPAPNNVAMFKLCFELHANGTLEVSAVDVISSKLMKKITITSYAPPHFKEMNAKNALKSYVDGIKRTLTHADGLYKGKMNVEDELKNKIMEAANEAIEWLNKDRSVKEYIDKKKELETLYNPIVPLQIHLVNLFMLGT